MAFELRYHPDVKKVDIPGLDRRLRERLKNAVESRLAVAPHQYGKPLRKTLHGYWKLRVGDYRVVFKISGTARRRVWRSVEGRRPETDTPGWRVLANGSGP